MYGTKPVARERGPNSTLPLLFGMLAIALSACNTKSPEPKSAVAVSSPCADRGDADYFFSDDTLRPNGNAVSDKELRRELSLLLAAGGSPSLSCGQSVDAYRFIWLPANRGALIISAMKDSTGWRIGRTASVSWKLRHAMYPFKTSANFSPRSTPPDSGRYRPPNRVRLTMGVVG
jgi:hypothetical protein